MSKKWAILLVILAEVLIYSLLLIGLPMLTNMLYSYGVCIEGKEFGISWVPYLVPGLFGILFVALIMKQKKGGKEIE